MVWCCKDTLFYVKSQKVVLKNVENHKKSSLKMWSFTESRTKKCNLLAYVGKNFDLC